MPPTNYRLIKVYWGPCLLRILLPALRHRDPRSHRVAVFPDGDVLATLPPQPAEVGVATGELLELQVRNRQVAGFLEAKASVLCPVVHCFPAHGSVHVAWKPRLLK